MAALAVTPHAASTALAVLAPHAGFLTRYLAQFILSDEVAALLPTYGFRPVDAAVRAE